MKDDKLMKVIENSSELNAYQKKQIAEKIGEKRFASANLTMVQVNALVKKLGGHHEVYSFLRDDQTSLIKLSPWIRQGSIIRTAVKNPIKRTPEDWSYEFGVSNDEISGTLSKQAKKLLLAGTNKFEATEDVLQKIIILPGNYFKPGKRTYDDIASTALQNGYSLINNLETALLLRHKLKKTHFAEVELNYINIMHEPIEIANDKNKVEQCVLRLHNLVNNEWLSCANIGKNWTGSISKNGFAFIDNN